MVTPLIGTWEMVGTTQVAETVLKLSCEPAVRTAPDQLVDSMFVGVATVSNPSVDRSRVPSGVGRGRAQNYSLTNWVAIF